MDTRNEDNIVRQIEKNLSNNINENLFLAGSLYGDSFPERGANTKKHREVSGGAPSETDYPLVSRDYMSHPQAVSRAEYIRQAREACLRNLSNQQIYTHAYDVNYMNQETFDTEQESKKSGMLRLFRDNAKDKDGEEEANPQELAAFRFLIIRTVCAVLIFLTIFLIDKLELKLGGITPQVIKEYVTGKDTLRVLEDIIFTWIK